MHSIMQTQYQVSEKEDRQGERRSSIARSTRETRAAGIIMDGFSGDVKAEAALFKSLI